MGKLGLLVLGLGDSQPERSSGAAASLLVVGLIAPVLAVYGPQSSLEDQAPVSSPLLHPVPAFGRGEPHSARLTRA